jgi:hypothetical protein
MSDSDINPEERLRYAGATTRHEGDGEERPTLGTADVSDLIGGGDILDGDRSALPTVDADVTAAEPGVGTANGNTASGSDR